MAKIIGTPPYLGTIGGFTIYKSGDQYFARQKADYGKKEIMRNPKCRRQRENMTEFGNASKVGAEIRRAWKKMGFFAQDSTTAHRMVSLLSEMQKGGQGTRGQQSMELSKFGQNLKGFTLGKGRSPIQHISEPPQIQLTTGAATNEPVITLAFSSKAHFNPKKKPAKAKYYAIHLHLTAISDYHYNEKEGKYLPEHPGGSESTAFTRTQPIPLTPRLALADSLCLALPANMHSSQNLIITWGIEYFAEENGQPKPIIISKPRSKCRQTEAYLEVHSMIQLEDESIEKGLEERQSKEITEKHSLNPPIPQGNKNSPISQRPNKPTRPITLTTPYGHRHVVAEHRKMPTLHIHAPYSWYNPERRDSEIERLDNLHIRLRPERHPLIGHSQRHVSDDSSGDRAGL